jgi:hypothetical protein
LENRAEVFPMFGKRSITVLFAGFVDALSRARYSKRSGERFYVFGKLE